MKTRIRILSLVSMLLLIFAGCGKDKTNSEVSNNHFTAGLKVRIVPAKIANIQQTLHYSGIIRGYREVAIAPGMSSWVTKILVKEGDIVRKGQILAKLSPEQFDQAKAQYTAAKENYERMKKLYSQGSISKQRFDQVDAGYKAAKAGFALASKNTELRAPFNGVVASVNVEQGAFYNSMMERSGILTVVELKKAKIEINVSDKDISSVKLNQSAFVRCDAFPDTVFIGSVESADKIADPYSGTYKVTVVVPNKDKIIRSGMFANVDVVIAKSDSAIVIPQSAIVSDTIIYIADGSKAKSRKIALGVQNDSLAQVIAGIEIGEPVIVEGTLGLFDGAPIVVKK
ncbi:efflux RND transporter periplasmic adaptor subunit [bacterium]|nr:efflux RND transporter periplasmic adaptor subunit [bacterium]